MASAEDTAEPGRREGPGRRTAFVAWAVTALIVVIFALISESNIGLSYGWDEGVYLASARWVAHHARLFETVFSSQPPVFLEILGAAFRLAGDSGETAARVSILFAAAALFSTAWIAHGTFGARAAPVAVLALLSRLFFDQATMIEAEMPALGLGLLSLAVLLPPGRRRPTIALAGGLFAVATLAKLWILPCAVPLAALLFVRRDADGRWRLRLRAEMGSAFVNALVFVLSGLAVGLVLISRYDISKIYDQAVRLHVMAREMGLETWGRPGIELIARFARKESFVLLLAVAGAGVLARKNPLVAAWLGAWLGVSALFLLGHAPIFNRHALLLAPPLALFAAGLQTVALRRPWGSVATATLLVLLVLRPSVGLEPFGWTVPVLTQLPAEYVPDPAQDEAIDLIRAVSRPDELVVTDVPLLVYLAGRNLPPGLVDASGTRILTHHLTTEEAIAYTDGVRVVVLWGDRLEQLPGYTAWVEAHYVRMRRWGRREGRRELYVTRAALPGDEPPPGVEPRPANAGPSGP